jgi:hypothetical protein
MSDFRNVALASQEFDKQMTKGDQDKEDMVMMLQPFNNMSAQLSAAPLCINILGQVQIKIVCLPKLALLNLC